MFLVDRDDELSILRGLYERCRDGAGGVAVVSGPVGSGKTALLHAFTDAAAEDGAVVLTAAAAFAESALTMGVMSQLLGGAQWPAETAARAQALLTAGMRAGAGEDWRSRLDPDLDGEPWATGAGGVPPDVLHGLSRLLLDLAEERPVVLGVDDIQHADQASMACLLHLARRVRSARVVIVLNECWRPQWAYMRFHTELFRQPSFSHIRLDLLSRSGTALLAARELGQRRAEPLIGDLYRISGGNPLLVRALIEDYRAAAGRSPEGPLPGEEFARTVSTCLYRGESTVRHVARALAVLGEHGSPTVLAETLDLGIEAVGDYMKALTVSGLLDGGRFRDEATRVAVLLSIAPAERQALHARVAEVLHDHGVSAKAVGAHLLAADHVDAGRAVPILQEAAAQALIDNEPGLATGLLRLAQEICVDPRLRAEIRMELFAVEWRGNPSAAARRLPDLVEAAMDSWLDWNDVSGLIAYLLWHGRPDDAMDVLKGQEAPFGREDDAGRRLSASARLLSFWYVGLTGRHPFDGDLGGTAGLDSTRDLQLRAPAVLLAVLTDGPGDGVVAQAEQILQSCQLDDATLPPLLMSVLTLMYADRTAEAARWCDRLAEEAAGRHAPMWEALMAATSAAIAVRQGRMAAAGSAAHRALSLVTPQSWGVAIGWVVATALTAAGALGDADAAAAYLSIPVPDAMFQTPAGLVYLQARGRHHLTAGRAHAALGDFRLCGELMDKWRLDTPVLVPWRVCAAEALLRLGRLEEARELAEQQLHRLDAEQVRIRGLCLRVLAAASEPGSRPALLEEAVELLGFSGDHYEQLLALVDLERAHLHSGTEDMARMAGRRAQRLAENCGVEPPRESLVPVAAPAPAVPLAPAADPLKELTDAERRVAALAVEGHTNRQIASKLFITVSTVEQHLTRIYRKLRVNRRSDLPKQLLSHSAG